MVSSDRPGAALPFPGPGSEAGRSPGSVLLITPGWTRDGGVGAHVISSAAVLAQAGIRVQVLAGYVDTAEGVPGVTVLESTNLFNSRLPVNQRLGDALSVEFDVIHLHQVDDPDIVGALRTRAPVVISAHGYTMCTSGVYYFQPGHECTRGHGPGCIPNLVARGCAHTRYPKTLPVKYRNATRGLRALRSADLVVSYSTSVDRHLAANEIADRTIVPYFPTLTPKARSGNAGTRRVLFAGRIVRPKGVDVLIRAAPEVDAEFVLCGEGRDLDEMRALAMALGVDARVSFKGWLGADELAVELANTSVVAVPSLWPEPFGIVGIEALAAGRPAVASATGGIVDWLEDGIGGLHVPPGDATALARALNELLEDPERQSAMGVAGGRMVAARFSPDRHLASLLEAYRSAQARWRSGRREIPAA
jgi:glycosyltransferase involved in cell wall biosynthesis